MIPDHSQYGFAPGHVAVIAGGSRGIGKAIAVRFVAAGVKVAVAARSRDDLETLQSQVESAGGDLLVVPADFRERGEAERVVDEVVTALGRIDSVMCTVGGHVGNDSSPLDCDDDLFESTVQLNLLAPWRVAKAAGRRMTAQGSGSITLFGSGDSVRAGRRVAYSTSKHAVIGLTKSLAQHWGKYGVRVNCLCPGWTSTGLNDWSRIGRSMGISADEALAFAESSTALGRVLGPDELAGMALLLGSDDGAGITGQVISVDGGYRL